MILDCMTGWLEAKRMKAQHSKAWLGFVAPEDLGRTREHEPASLWQLRELRELARRFNMHRVAFCQCRFGASDHPRPTGLLATPQPTSGVFKAGWPKLDGDYFGPLPRQCGCGSKHASMLVKKGEFHTPRRMLETGTVRLLAATLASSVYGAKVTAQGLSAKWGDRMLFEALLPSARFYPLDEDGYDTEATIIVDPPDEPEPILETPTETAQKRAKVLEKQAPADQATCWS